MAKKMNFRNDMKEAKAPEVSAEETERLPTENGYTRTKRKLKGTKNNEQTLRHGKKPIEKKQSGKLKSAVVSQQLHRKIAEVDEDDNIGVESVNRGVQAAEAGADVARGTVQKVKKYGNKLHDRAVKPEVNAEKETLRHMWRKNSQKALKLLQWLKRPARRQSLQGNPIRCPGLCSGKASSRTTLQQEQEELSAIRRFTVTL